MFNFIAPNESVNEGEKTYLDADSAIGATTITVERAGDYASNDFLRIGRRGKEKSELRKISSITGNVITLSTALTYAHLDGDEVVKLFYDQRKLYKETAIGSGVYAISGTAKTIEIDNPDGTLFQDSAGSASYRYKCTYYNSHTLAETSQADAVAVYGGDSGTYCSIDEIRAEAGFEDNAYVNDGDILKMRNKATNEVDAALKNVYTLPLSYVPEIITDITKKLAAGRLMSKQYAGIEPMFEKLGKEMLKEARSLLKDITNRKLILMDASSNQLSKVDTGKPSGWPDGTTEDEDEDNAGGGRMFSRLKVF